MTTPDGNCTWARGTVSMIKAAALFFCALAAPAGAQPAIGLAEVIASQVGHWQGRLEYRDYQSNKWEGIPVTVEILDGGDSVTQIRTADFDDGPRVGNVRITTISMLGQDGKTEYSTAFRKGRMPELSTVQLTLNDARDALHWSIIAAETATDDDRPAVIRTTLTRDGDHLTSLKEVDFSDDAQTEWLARNRTILDRVGD
jgi:hypothetical protein